MGLPCETFFPASRQDPRRPVHYVNMGLGNRDLTQNYPESKHIAVNSESSHACDRV